ncbi:iron-sulfur protein [Streptomyces albospinus]|uniref:Iron-sulfur protein n=1 Tax=Streptomyces albospinus TaxID=285515 RepID=A0ABQ2UWG0_9ACTN|nr:PDR/VanB family oxidoreductase [Streptomyces albospinus]GGU53360.1 iron-sulfur protein [Streptomyces albospinus]
MPARPLTSISAPIRTSSPAPARTLPRLRTVLLVAGAAVVVRRALRRRIRQSPLWPLPALEQPISGRGRERGRAAPLRLRVAERTEAAEGVVVLRLEGERLPGWEPGAHLDLVLPSGTVRQYSLCGEPADAVRADGGTYTIATRLIEDGRGGSREVHEALHEGTTVEVRGPRNRFPLDGCHAYLFIAGGIGITPILPMVRQAEAAGIPWRLVYAGRSRASMPFLEELEKLAGAGGLAGDGARGAGENGGAAGAGAARGAGGGRLTVVAEDEAGRPDLAAALADAPPHAAVYCCGPEPLMDAVADLLPNGPEGLTLHIERFAPRTGPGSGPGSGDGSGEGEGEDVAFEVELRRTGRTVTVPADTSVLRALREQALPDLPYSCEQGFCGTCRQRVLAGEVDHRDELLTDAEREDSLLICVSRSARGEGLVLDL